jgi:hypothetical protein
MRRLDGLAWSRLDAGGRLAARRCSLRIADGLPTARDDLATMAAGQQRNLDVVREICKTPLRGKHYDSFRARIDARIDPEVARCRPRLRSRSATLARLPPDGLS